MFEGVLDNGEDAIFLGNESKFTAMMDTLGENFEEEKQQAAAPAVPAGSTDGDTADEPEPVKEEQESAKEEPIEKKLVGDTLEGNDSAAKEDEPAAPSATESPQAAATSSGTKTPRQPKEHIEQGISFLSGLSATLKLPEATAHLVETLVETNAETGQTSLKIPVPNKQTVRNLLDIVGKLFG